MSLAISLGRVFSAIVSIALPLGVGTALFFGGLSARAALTPNDGDIVVQGEVVSFDIGERDETIFTPIIEYVDPVTSETFFITNGPASGEEPVIGSTRDLAFPAGDPSNGRVVGMVWFAWIFILCGAASFLWGVLLIKSLFKEKTGDSDAVLPVTPQDAVRPTTPQDAVIQDRVLD